MTIMTFAILAWYVKIPSPKREKRRMETAENTDNKRFSCLTSRKMNYVLGKEHINWLSGLAKHCAQQEIAAR